MLKHFLIIFFITHAFTTLVIGKNLGTFNNLQIQEDYDWHQQQQQRQNIVGRQTNTCSERQTPGPICESCELLATCVYHSNGWMNIPVETCDNENGFYCNSRLGMCSNATGPCHPFGMEGNFQCTSNGIFPDPYDCQKYHVCHFIGNAIVPATVDCAGDKAFNAATGQCSLTIQDPVCTQQQIQCINAGDAHPWPNNPNIFYICSASSNQNKRILYPSLYRCADGEIFESYSCRADHNIPNYPPSQPTLSPGGFPTSSSTSRPTDSPMRKCNEIGLSADPNDCHSYYYCSGVNGDLKHLQCPMNTYYNHALSSCMLGSC